ncbi:DUF11 domain-containing protein, partial [Lewinella lacunae]|nr:DUF11 domain-containing protein [Neolewinella lacunae]
SFPGGAQDDTDPQSDENGNMTIDFGFVPVNSVGSSVFYDVNNNGIQEGTEQGIPGTTVQLFADLDGDGTPETLVGETTTDEDGIYFFDNLPDGTYTVVIPNGPANTDGPSAVSSDDAGNEAVQNGEEGPNGSVSSAPFDLIAGDNPVETGTYPGDDQDDAEDTDGNMTIDFGFVPFGFDLALIKELAPGQSSIIQPGDTVEFTITVFNQGVFNADSILITDYLPSLMTFDASIAGNDAGAGWAQTGGLVQRYLSVAAGDLPAGGLAPAATVTVSIFLTVNNPVAPNTAIDNFAEVSASNDEFGNDFSELDIDSDYNEDNDDVLLQDNEIGGDGTAGEDADQHDIATVTTAFFDLALVKTLADGQASSARPGDTVFFTITVFNQGAIPADNILISDYVDADVNGFMFDPTIPVNAAGGWMENGTVGIDSLLVQTTLTDFNGEETLAPGATVSIDIALVINPAMEVFMTLTNLAEISAATDPDGVPQTDIDSPMDEDPTNDPFFQDNEIEGDGTSGEDEDNSDPATINVGAFDLALVKTLAPGQLNVVVPGQEVTFDITVFNQGAIPADNIELIDFIPAGFLFDAGLNPDWADNADGTASTTLTVMDGELPDGGLLPGQNVTIQIVLTVAEPTFPDYVLGEVGPDDVNPDGVEPGQVLTNAAEIVSATDENGDPVDDIDSTPDDNPDNDGDVVDNDIINTDGDQDDHDIAIVTVECYQDPGRSATIEVCLGCDEAVVVINLFDALGGRPNIGGIFSEDAEYFFIDDNGDRVAVDISDPENVVIPGTLDRSLDYKIVYTIPAINGCPERTARITIDVIDIQNLTCNGFTNISLGEDCEATITPSQILQGEINCASSLTVEISTLSGVIIGNTVSSEHIGQTLIVSLFDAQCDNSCWGQILVEDKQRPTIVCPDDTDSFGDVDFICTDLDRILQTTAVTYSPDNIPAVLNITGIPEVADNCTATNDLVVQFYDFLQPVDDPQCEVRTIIRTFTVTDGSGNRATCTQEITVRPPTLADVTIPTEEVVEISCGIAYEALPNGNPVPSLGGEAFVTTAYGNFPIPGNGSYCTIAASFEDSERVITCENTFKFVRTFRIFDWCEPGGESITYSQVIKVGDFEAPVFTAQTQDNDFDGIADNGPLVFSTNSGNECTAIFRLDDPGIRLVDNCSASIALSAVIYPNGDLTATPIGTFVVDLNDGDAELTSAIPVGQHVLRYTYVDVCGNSDFTDIDILIEDRTAPVAVCEDGLNVSLTSGSEGGIESTGIVRLTPDMIDHGSTDDCSEVTLAIARVDAANLAMEAYSQEIILTCADLGTVRVGLRVTDAAGNVNYCWLDVLVEDKLAPSCIPPASLTMSCIEYRAALPADITETTVEARNAIFGAAAGVDNCEATLTETISGSLNSCGVGSFTRVFTVTDGQGLTNTIPCTQTINVFGIHDYTITFPTDESGTCAEIPSYGSIAADELACDLITTTVSVDTLRTLEAGEECFKLRVTYDVVNWCEYNTLGQPYLIPRDGDGIRNPETQLLYLHVIPRNTDNTADDFAFLSRFTDRNYNPNAPQFDQTLDDGNDMDGSDDDNGNDNIDSDVYAADNSRGAFRYVQYIKIYDEVAPVIVAQSPDECIGGAGEDCEATVTLTFTATDECSDITVGLELDANYLVGNGFIPDNAAALGVSITLTSDTAGNYTIVATNVPVGEHAIRIRANDGCGNSDIEILEFCVTPDKAPTPICIQTLTATLIPDGQGGGMAAIWASDFIASDVEDCFGNVIDQYSIYTETEAGAGGFNPAAGRLGIDLDCDDLGDLPVRVYAIDNNGNGDYCSVVVQVQAFQEGLCEVEGASLAGVIMTESMQAVENVVVNVEGGDNLQRTMTTGNDGVFSFTGLPVGVDYTVTPSNYTDYLNGVRTSDIVAISRHILGIAELDSPYKHIAADVDGNTEINVGDIINIRRLILGLSDAYPNDMPSWAFIPADYNFADLSNPWAETFPQVMNFNNLANNIPGADFVGVKLGDVNGTAIANAFMPTAPRNLRGDLELEMDETQLIQGETYRIPVTAPDLTEVDGYQFTLEFDRTAVSIEGIEPGLVQAGNFGWRFASQGLITTSWNWEGVERPINWTGKEVLFTLVVRAQASGKLSNAIATGSRFTEAEAYNAGGTSLRNLSLIFNEEIIQVAGYRLLQNLPNPVSKETTIGFELPEAHAEVTIAITDAAGRLVREYRQEGFVGYNSVRISKRELGGASGVYTYTVQAGKWVATKRMVVIE